AGLKYALKPEGTFQGGSSAVTELSISGLETLRSDGEFVLQRGRMGNDQGRVLVLAPVLEQPSECSRKRLEHEYALSGELGAGWAVRAVALGRWRGRMVLVLEDPGGEPLDRVLRRPLELRQALRLAIGVAGGTGSGARSGVDPQGWVHLSADIVEINREPCVL